MRTKKEWSGATGQSTSFWLPAWISWLRRLKTLQPRRVWPWPSTSTWRLSAKEDRAKIESSPTSTRGWLRVSWRIWNLWSRSAKTNLLPYSMTATATSSKCLRKSLPQRKRTSRFLMNVTMIINIIITDKALRPIQIFKLRIEQVTISFWGQWLLKFDSVNFFIINF